MSDTNTRNPSTAAEMRRQLQGFIDRRELSGMVWLTWQRGAVIDAGAMGYRDIESRSPIENDTLFRIASMTKPVTTVAALILLEQGLIQLTDPISRWLPELTDMRVLRVPEGPLDDTVPADRPVTVEDLMTHRSGIAHPMFSEGPIAEAYLRALGPSLGNEKTPDEWVAALGTLPLKYQPGDRMHYGQSTDLLGFLVARIAGKPFAEVLLEQIFAPLGMNDTGFYVPADKRDRLATMYRFDSADGKPVAVPMPAFEQKLAYASGGAGLVSTAQDYLHFARLLLNDGEIDGVRLLTPETVRSMRTNRLTEAQRSFLFVGADVWAGMGFGLGLAVVDVPERNVLGCGHIGAFTWPGAYGTWWEADPVEDRVMILLFQHMVPFTPTAGATIAAGRGMAGRQALSVYQKATLEGLP